METSLSPLTHSLPHASSCWASCGRDEAGEELLAGTMPGDSSILVN